ncbi:ComEC/Rec2 family competence protein [Salinisphaera orenii]|uniref:ComEC/Rec2 family competence protein n=1 Tax=Salinisphaera orenii TaxID=856731 RepID=UPI000DBE62A5
MGYEIDVLGIGEGSTSGDAITVRYGNLFGPREEQRVIVIDGGFQGNGDDVVEHVRSNYDTKKVDLAISTHPDQDHIGGLATVLENLEVDQLWIHKAWQHKQGLAAKFKDGRITDQSIGERLKASLEQAHDLTNIAEREGVTVTEPFAGLTFDALNVLGPSKDYYEELLPKFQGMPDSKFEDRSVLESTFESLREKAEKTWKKICAVWGVDKISDDDNTSAKNNSSVITQLSVDGRILLFTGDAGITALDKAADSLSGDADVKYIQIPHHGSQRNVGPAVLNRLVGRPVAQDQSQKFTAIVSCAKEGEPKHPNKAVLNAFTHRGAKVLATRGRGICSHWQAPQRDGWATVNPEPYYYEYKDEV